MGELVLMPASHGGDKPFALVIRRHDLSGTAYQHIAYVSEATGREIVRAGKPSWLYGDPAGRRALSDQGGSADG